MNQTFQKKPYLAGLLTAVIIFLLDQWSKIEIVYDVMMPPKIIEVTSFFNIVMAWNRGVSFGMFGWDSQIKIYVLAAMAFVAAVGLTIWMIREGRLIFAIPCGAIIGGAIGNGIDRLHWGAVADFLDFHIAGYHWPAFNVADIGITCGATFLILDSLFSKQDSSKTEDSD
ncbi:Lipoprotein signal peptidase [Candidatus Terasakiella magnetica]|uniref:Lipoprotein signal peptidase n=1 Tax=Candidatus Terasakiella magnetica TaxID=1867952 RepID=A0A1C3RIH6_9PROT|nr:signal peptidase II [Candidatus Terasakiella magnetica]SCA57071.1 Lipoprotein signal peptidase [Candidatus Terasakiella magnetica]